MYCSSPASSIRRKAIAGQAVCSILLSSSATRSQDRIFSRSAIRRIESIDSGTMVKRRPGVESFAAKRTARSIRSGSSE